jgi:hypothetical protein
VPSRAALTMFGGGFGAGVSWVECKQYFASTKQLTPTMSKFTIPNVNLNPSSNNKDSKQ